MIHSEERFPCLEKAREATLEVAKEKAPKAKGGKEESQAAMILGHREYGVPVLSIMEEPSQIYADFIYDSSGSTDSKRMKRKYIEFVEATFQPPEETTTSSSVASPLIIEV